MGEQITVEAVGEVDKYKALRELVKHTHKEKPHPEDLAALRRFFDGDPELWRPAGSMAKRTLDHLLRTYYQQSAYIQECVGRRVAEMREQFGFAEGSPLEKLLIEQILVCYVNLYVLEINSASKLCESHSTETGLYWDRRLTGAQRRFRRACETLARIRKLSRNAPALQLNIAAKGGQQVNLTK
jgi:hypothetical protein